MNRHDTRVLIVDDDRLVLSGLADGLEERGYKVAKAASGEEALSLVESSQPDIVIMDICLPGMTGIEAAQEIRKKLDVPVIFLSAMNSSEIVREAIATGGLTYLVKPITVKQLVPAIESALARAADLAKLTEQETNLTAALKQGREISVAIGILVERHGTTPEEAYERLRAHARATRRKAVSIAVDIISGVLDLEPSGAPGARRE
jgi:response regulator NasT